MLRQWGLVRDVACPWMFRQHVSRLLADTHAEGDYGTGPESSALSLLSENGQIVKFKSSDVPTRIVLVVARDHILRHGHSTHVLFVVSRIIMAVVVL